MKLTLDSVLPYLVERGLVDVAEILDEQVSVTDASRRNSNFQVRRANGDGYLLKQAVEGALDAERTLAVEATFYRFCEEDPRGEALRRVVPRLRAYVPEEALLVTRFIDGAEPLWKALRGAGSGLAGEPPNPGPAGLVGEPPKPPAQPVSLGEPPNPRGVPRRDGPAARARARHAPRGAVASRRSPVIRGSPLPCPRHPPWILWAHKPGPDVFATLSGAGVQTLRILQNMGELRRHLDELRRDARCEALVHGDVKSDNVLVSREGGEGGEAWLCLVDWELLHFGDPAWDVGGAFFDFLQFWITSMPIAPGKSPAELMAEARSPLDRIQPAIRGFWSTYCSLTGLAAGGARAFLSRAARFCAARLVQGAYEHAQDAPLLSNVGVMMLQVAAHVFARPEAAAKHLFALAA